jgi:hypothetical protein
MPAKADVRSGRVVQAKAQTSLAAGKANDRSSSADEFEQF